MLLSTKRGAEASFDAFFRRIEPRLREALVATYGPADGREAAVEALSWAWEHLDRFDDIQHPVRYLYRVGQTAVRRFSPRPVPLEVSPASGHLEPGISAPLASALGRLSAQQRTAVLLVHAFGWSQADVAELFGIAPSTVHEHLNRGLARLREDMEVRNAC